MRGQSLLTSHISALCVAELLALMVSPSPSRSPSRSLSPPGIWAPVCEGDGDGGCSASVQNNVRGPWSSQKWQRATSAFIWKTGNSLIWLIVFESANRNDKIRYNYNCNYTMLFHVYDQREVVPSALSVSGITRAWSGRVQEMISNRLTSGKQSESTNVWCSKPHYVKTFVWSQKRHG